MTNHSENRIYIGHCNSLPRNLLTQAFRDYGPTCLGQFSLYFCLFTVSLLSSAEAFTLSTNVEFGGEFDDGALHLVPPNLLAQDPFRVQGTTQVGAYVTNSSTLNVQAPGRIDVDENSSGDAVGIFASVGSVVEVEPGGRITVSETSNGNALGLVVNSDGLVDFSGSINLGESGNSASFVAEVNDTGVLRFSGSASTSEGGNSNAIGFFATDFSRVEFDGSISISEFGNGDAIPLHAVGNAYFESQGTIEVNEDGNSARVGVLVEDNAVAKLTGGSLTIRTDGLSGNAKLVMLELNDQATVSISGGAYQVFEDGFARQPFARVNDGSQLIISGSDFNYPLGTISDSTGVVTGILGDGQSFSFEFARDTGASILLVPEPSSLLLFVSFIAGISCPRLLRLSACTHM